MVEIPLVERVVLVGFLGSGKSVVGHALALRLEWDFVDFDAEIMAREGRPLSVVSQEEGQEYLRQVEQALTEEVANRSRLVIAPGGAWIMQPELLESLGPATLAIWLRVSPSEAYDRIRALSDDHPWHSESEPIDRIGDLMRERESLYRLADMSIPTNWRSPEAIAFEIEQIIRTRGCSIQFAGEAAA